MDNYEQKYNEAMLRADEAVQKGSLDKNIFDIIFPPEESEDERIRKAIIYNLSNLNIIYNATKEECLSWLEKQKEQKQEWSEEDKKLIDDVINSLCCYQNTLSDYQKEIIGEEIRKLKSLRSVKREWSEEDERMLKCCLIAINHYEKTCNIGDHRPTKFNIDGYLAYVDKVKYWLKSLRPQKKEDLPKWKIAKKDEDTDTLDYAILFKHDGGDHEDWWSVEVTNRLRQGELYFELADLERLSKENKK